MATEDQSRIVDAEIAAGSSQPAKEPNMAQRLVARVQSEVTSNAPAYIEGAKTVGEVTVAVAAATTASPKDGLGQNLLHWGVAALAGLDAGRRTTNALRGKTTAETELAVAQGIIKDQRVELTELREGKEEVETTRSTWGPFVRNKETRRTVQGYRSGRDRNGSPTELPALGAPQAPQGSKNGKTK